MTEERALQRIFACAAAAVEKRAERPVVLDVRGLSGVADYYLIVSGSSDRRVQTIAEAVIETMREEGVRPLGVEGLREGRWVLVDFGEWVAHVFYEEMRDFYDLEGLWFDAPRVELPAGLEAAR
ncbi:MAG: ribosome silencing factor [Deltaproteobacteria bacterium]|nr:ribosome silencing factor [Deltaproteobacteria bacterium]